MARTCSCSLLVPLMGAAPILLCPVPLILNCAACPGPAFSTDPPHLSGEGWVVSTSTRLPGQLSWLLQAAQKYVRASDVAGGKSSEPGAATCCSQIQNNFSATATHPLGHEFWVSLLAATSQNLQMKSCAAEEQGWSRKKHHTADLPGPH